MRLCYVSHCVCKTVGTNFRSSVLCVTLCVLTAGTNFRFDCVVCRVVCAEQQERTLGAAMLCVQKSENEL